MNSKIESLRLRAIALRSTVHNEHMLSAIDLCAMVSKKTNEIIDVVNELCDIIEKLEVEGTGARVVYNPDNQSLTIE